MANFEIIMPKMGESIEEATITKWFVKEGDMVTEDQVLLEIATDKVDSEIPSPVAGLIQKILYKQDETVAVGSVIAIINLEGQAELKSEAAIPPAEKKDTPKPQESIPAPQQLSSSTGRFYSPLVKKIAAEENLSQAELDSIQGSGLNGRVQKNDVLNYLKNRKENTVATVQPASRPQLEKPKVHVSFSAEDEIIQMDRLRKLIAEHMIHSVQTSAHVTNMLEADVTEIVNWRNARKDDFARKEGVKLTYLPIFLEAAARALKDYPLINSSVDGDRIIVKKRINMGVAVALPDNNLIVPVIKNIDQLNLVGISKELNRLADAARSGKLKPDEIQDGTFTVTNFGTFKNTIGTPIINQPQVAILATGAIEKKPAVIETSYGDVIAIRHKMFLSLTYDHRIIDGALGGSYLRKVADYIEGFDINRIV